MIEAKYTIVIGGEKHEVTKEELLKIRDEIDKLFPRATPSPLKDWPTIPKIDPQDNRPKPWFEPQPTYPPYNPVWCGTKPQQ